MRHHALGVFALVTLTAACASVEPVEHSGSVSELEPGGVVMTRAEIRASGANSALEAVERSRSHLSFVRTRAGTPVRMTHRGNGSFLLSPEVLLVVDGTRVQHPAQMLQSIPAPSILYIQILSGREASTRFGSQAGNGVILVRTTAR